MGMIGIEPISTHPQRVIITIKLHYNNNNKELIANSIGRVIAF